MKRTIEFILGVQNFLIDADEIIIPRIGESVDIYNFINTKEARKEYNKTRNNRKLYVVDIVHDIGFNSQLMQVYLPPDLGFKNDFYNSICPYLD